MKIPLQKGWKQLLVNFDEMDQWEPKEKVVKPKSTRNKIDKAIIQGLITNILFHNNNQQKPIHDVINDVCCYYGLDEKQKQNIVKRTFI